MKLLDRTNLYFLSAAVLIFGLGGLLFYFMFKEVINNDLSEKLRERKDYVLKQLEKNDSILNYQSISGNTVSITRAAGKYPLVEQCSDTTMFDRVEDNYKTYRQLVFRAEVRGQWYGIAVRRLIVEDTGFIRGVVLLESGLFLAFVALLTLINSLLSRRIWKPFYRILDAISGYKIDQGESLQLGRGAISEFNDLAAAIEKMTVKIRKEFLIQKEFTENASHEIQTPLAIIRNKMEILLQSPDVTEEQMLLIKSMYSAAGRLSKLNEALLILSRIENRQFHAVSDICVNDLIDHRLNGLEELIQMKNLTVEKQYDYRLRTKMNPYLADILFENLIVNAIKHNQPDGRIRIHITEGKISIANSGEPPRVAPDKLFGRFVKDNQKSSSLGLGLPIVKAICDTYSFPIAYTYEGQLHKMTVQLVSEGVLVA
ncbi:MAG: HAMP domain-containing histidine kinase [Bacteroidetes bacterium]|nr:HAMP domain-containing histidine kinase [Bacteroidota bacterium]